VSRDSELQQIVAAGIDLRLREDAISALELIGKLTFISVPH